MPKLLGHSGKEREPRRSRFFRSLPRPDLSQPGQHMAYPILVCSVPASLIHFFFEGFFRTAVRSPWLVAVVRGLEPSDRGSAVPGWRGRGVREPGVIQAHLLGDAREGVCPTPPRSFRGSPTRGAAVTLGLFLGLRREEAARFSFLISVTVAAGFGALSTAKATGGRMASHQALLFLLGSV